MMSDETSRKHILIIEDDATFGNMLKLRLELNGYQATTVQDGIDGFELAKSLLPDLIILDLTLPEMVRSDSGLPDQIHLDRNMGHKVCRMIKFEKHLSHIPVLILTCSDTDGDAALANKCGADAYVLKTTNTEILLDIIKKLLNRI
jgi:DNA-binding response OmpR family regulator